MLVCAQKASGRSTNPRGIRLPARLEQTIQHEADARKQSWSATTAELLDEAIRMRRAPGVLFVDGATGRRAVLAGTALEVWEIVATWRESGEDAGELARSYPWLSEMQLRAALGYYRFYPDEIDQLKVTLEGIRPPIWRRLLVASGTTLSELHDIVQEAMGWENYHMHAFEIDGRRFGEPYPELEMADLLDALADPEHPDFEERMEWLGGTSIRRRSIPKRRTRG